MNDSILWEGKPSQFMNVKYFAVCLLLCWLIVPLYLAWRRFRATQQMRFLVKDKSVNIYHPNTYKYNRLLEMYRIQTVEVQNPAPYSAFSLCDVVFNPTDNFTPPVVFQAVSFPPELAGRVKAKADEVREKKRIKEISIPILQ